MGQESVRYNKHDFVTQDLNFDHKLDLITAGGRPRVKEHLLTRITRENCQVIINYILAFTTEVSPAPRYRLNTIGKLKQLAQYYHPRGRVMTKATLKKTYWENEK